MNKNLPNKNGFTLIEFIMVAAILLIIVGFVLRIIYATEFNTWEDNFWKSIGFNPELAKFIIGSTALLIFGLVAIKRRKAKKKKHVIE